MRMLGQVLAIILLAAAVSVPAVGQGYEPPKRPNQHDIYCAGFVASSKLPADLQIVMGEDATGRLIFAKNDYVYLSGGQDAGVQPGNRYLVVRPRKEPTGIEAFGGQRAIFNAMGYYYQDIGRVRVDYVHPNSATGTVTHACVELQAGDILIPFQARPVPEYKPAVEFDRFMPPSGRAQATVIMGKDFQYLVGQSDAIYVNLGSNQGVVVGDYYTLYRSAHEPLYRGYDDMEDLAGRVKVDRLRGYDGEFFYEAAPKLYDVPDPADADLPREVLGEALVVHVDGDSSTAVITTSLREVHAGDFVELQPPPQPRAELDVLPSTITRGDSATLTWESQAANQTTITPGIGAVDFDGTLAVSPSQTTTYTFQVQGRGGAAQATATLTVQELPPPPAPPRPPEPPAPSLEELFAQEVEDVFFAFDKANLTDQAMSKLQRAARFLRQHPEARVLLEGHADEIGTETYNMRLGGRRAQAVRDYLVNQGVAPAQLQTVTLGESQPFCTESSEDWCRALNRRVHFVLQR